MCSNKVKNMKWISMNDYYIQKEYQLNPNTLYKTN